jgi:hypothetical protein
MPIQTAILSGFRYAALAEVLLLIFTGQGEGSVINATSTSFADIKSAVSRASTGDTVTIPAGTSRWTQTLTVTKGITILGSTLISGDHDAEMHSNDQTVIVDDVPISGAAGNAMIIDFSCKSGEAGRISGITFRQGSRTQTPNHGGIRVTGASRQFRIDHCHFDNLSTGNLTISGNIYGVIDHCIFSETKFATAIFVTNGGGAYGDEAWTQAAQFGTANFIFVEDSTFSWTGDPAIQGAGGLDSYKGGRYVTRYCVFNNCKPHSHGTDSSGRIRSSRAIEIYNNKLNWSRGYSPTGGLLRGGGLLIHDNIYTNYASGFSLRVYREFFPFFFGGAFGTNPWDSNDPHGVYESGTHGGPDGATTLTKTAANWTANQWVGYSIINTVTGRGSYVRSNTRDTITYAVDNGYGKAPNLVFNKGDRFEIRKVLIALDQPGRGKGDLLTGHQPVNARTGAATWPDQALEPVYSWNNTNNGENLDVSTYGEPTLVAGRDYYNQTPMPGYTPFIYPHPLVSEQPTPAPPGSSPSATAASPATDTPGSPRGFGSKRKKKADSAKSKKIPGRPD